MQGPHARTLSQNRLHLQHGPIDLIIGADGPGRALAFEAARVRFETVLSGLVEDLPQHRSQLTPQTPAPHDPVAQRMTNAARPFCTGHFVTPMIAVAGAVADTILRAMTCATSLSRGYVNNGGDIAVHLTAEETFSIAMASHLGHNLGRVHLRADDGVKGIATSGCHGRSLSLGIADSVTVLARDAATADAAATLIANAVDLPDHPGILRTPAHDIDPDSDLGARLVVRRVPHLSLQDSAAALASGIALAEQMHKAGHIIGAALFLQSQSALIGAGFDTQPNKELVHA